MEYYKQLSISNIIKTTVSLTYLNTAVIPNRRSCYIWARYSVRNMEMVKHKRSWF